MKALLENRLAPITFSFGFIKSPAESVAETLLNRTKNFHPTAYIITLENSLEAALRSLLPLTGLKRRELVMPTKSPWTAYFDNIGRGGDAFPAVSYVCDVLQVQGISVSCIANTKTRDHARKGAYGAVSFTLYAPHKTDFVNIERAIAAANDGGRWVFRESGKIQPFENTERYQSKRIADRFTSEMLEQYCSAFGIRLFEASFYGPGGLLLNVSDPLPNGHPGWSLAEAREYYGLV